MNTTLNLNKQLIGLDGKPAVIETTAGSEPLTIKKILLQALNKPTNSKDLNTVAKVYARGQIVEQVKANAALTLTTELSDLIAGCLFATGQTPSTVYQIMQEMGVVPST